MKIAVLTKHVLRSQRQELEQKLKSQGFKDDTFIFMGCFSSTYDGDYSRSDLKDARADFKENVNSHSVDAILTMGNESLYCATGHSGIMRYRGQLQDLPTPVMPTIALGAVDKNPSQIQLLYADIRALYSHLYAVKEVEGKPDKITVITTREKMDDFLAACQVANAVAFDLETSSFNELAEDSFIVSMGMTLLTDETMTCWSIPLHHRASVWKETWRDQLRFCTEAMKPIPTRVAHNCFSGDTQFITRDGVCRLDEAPSQVEVWAENDWHKGTVRSYGEASLTEIEFAPSQYRSNVRHYVKATNNHRWLTTDQSWVTTDQLSVGSEIKASKVDIEPRLNSEAFIHGLIFADGALCSKQPKDRFKFQLRLCGAKAKWLHLFPQHTYPPSAEGDPIATGHLNFNPKALPSSTDPQYIADFIEGWHIMDATNFANGRDLRTRDKKAALWVSKHAALAGWYNTGYSAHEHNGSYKPGTIYSVKLTKNNPDKPVAWRVKSLTPITDKSLVWCVEVPGPEAFTLSSGIYTGNSKFDCRWLEQFNAALPSNFDTMLAAHLLNENRMKGLKPLAQMLLNAEPWDISIAGGKNAPPWYTQHLLKDIVRYNAMDTWHTMRLYRYFKPQLEEDPRLVALFSKLIMPASQSLVHIERRGVYIDREALKEGASIVRDELERIHDAMMRFVPKGTQNVNFNPSNFLRWLLFDHLGLPVIQEGKTGPSVAESVIAHLHDSHPHPILPLILERVKWQKFQSSFFNPYQELITDESRLHTTFNIAGTVTGRLSSGKADSTKVTGSRSSAIRGINLQQVPRDPLVRGLFGAPPGFTFIEADYSQVELRIAAEISGEPTLRQLYAQGADIHMTMAMTMTGKPKSQISKEERKMAKAVNFGFIYGMGAKKFIETAYNNYGLTVTFEEAQTSRTAFFQQFSYLQRWHAQQRRLAHKYERVQSPLGRLRHLPDINSKDQGVVGEAERQSINAPVQGFASDLCLLSLVLLDRSFRRHRYEAHPIGTVHDSILFECRNDHLDKVLPLIKKTMENPPLEKLFSYRLEIPLVVDIATGQAWGKCQEIDFDTMSS